MLSKCCEHDSEEYIDKILMQDWNELFTDAFDNMENIKVSRIGCHKYGYAYGFTEEEVSQQVKIKIEALFPSQI